MDPIIKVLVLKSESKVLITKIKEIQSELGAVSYTHLTLPTTPYV